MKRTTEEEQIQARITSVVRFTDYSLFVRHPSSELLGYYHSSAAAD